MERLASRSMPRFVTVEKVVQEAGPSGVGQKLGPEADEPSGGDPEFEADPAVTVVIHLLHPAFTDPDLLGHNADELFRDIDDKMFHGLWRMPSRIW